MPGIARNMVGFFFAEFGNTGVISLRY